MALRVFIVVELIRFFHAALQLSFAVTQLNQLLFHSCRSWARHRVCQRDPWLDPVKIVDTKTQFQHCRYQLSACPSDLLGHSTCCIYRKLPVQPEAHPLQIYLWPFNLEIGVWVTCDVGYLCANFSLPRPLCSRLRPDARDRQTDVRQISDAHHRPYGGGGIIKSRM